DWRSGNRSTVVIDPGGGVRPLSGHMRQGGITVRVGGRVSRGQTIADSHATVRVTGPHLPFEVRIDGKPVDPMPYL
ncbi:peptidoglycan DD-metalloendopeptidase family protein, partial [Paenibacillus jilunlii]